MTSAYLYSLRNGKLKVEEGTVVEVNSYGKTLFKIPTVRGTRSVHCSSVEGIVHNKSIWLEKRDDKKARNILIEYEKFCIAELEAKIAAHARHIETLTKL